MNRREFLKNVTALVLPSSLFLKEVSLIQAFSGMSSSNNDIELARSRALDIVNLINPDDYGKHKLVDEKVLRYLKNEGLRYVKGEVLDTLNSKKTFMEVLNLGVNKYLFKNVLSTNPPFTIPLFAEILYDFGEEKISGKGLRLLSTIIKNEKENAFWIGSGSDIREMGNKRYVTFFMSDSEILTFGKGGLNSTFSGKGVFYAKLIEKGNLLNVESYYFTKTFLGMFPEKGMNIFRKSFSDFCYLPERSIQTLLNRESEIMSKINSMDFYSDEKKSYLTRILFEAKFLRFPIHLF